MNMPGLHFFKSKQAPCVPIASAQEIPCRAAQQLFISDEQSSGIKAEVGLRSRNRIPYMQLCIGLFQNQNFSHSLN